jgi:hypothetical protein
MSEIQRKIKPTSSWELLQLQIYEQAYLGYEEGVSPEWNPHHPKHVLTAAEMNDPDRTRLWRPRNFLAKVLEEPVGYLGHTSARLNVLRRLDDGTYEEIDVDVEADKALQGKIDDFYQQKIRPRQADLVLWQGEFGRSFAKVTFDPGTWLHKNAAGEVVAYEGEPGLHVVPYPRMEQGVERANAWHDSEDPDRVTSAVVFWFERDEDHWDEEKEQKRAQLLYPDRVEWLKLTGSGWVLDPERSQSGTGIDPHPWDVTPLAVCWNNGKPDVHDGLDTQKTINKDVYDLNVGMQQVAFPQRWRKGLIPAGGWLRNPLTGQREVVEPLRSGPHIVWDVPEGGEVGQLPADMGAYPLEKYNGDIEDLATLTRSVAIAKMKIASDTSGSSKEMDTSQLLLPRLRAKAEGLGACIRDIYRIVFAMAKADPKVRELLGIDEVDNLVVQVQFDLNLDRDDQAEAALDQADRRDGNMSLVTYLQRRGLTESEAEKEVKLLEAERATQRKEMADEAASMAKATEPYSGKPGGGGFGA